MGEQTIQRQEYVLFDNDMPEPVEISEAHQKKLDLLTKIHWG